MINTNRPAIHPVEMGSLAIMVMLLNGCSRSADRKSIEPSNELREVLQEDTIEGYYRAHADFFHFATRADIPDNLEWHNGMDLPEFSSPDAQKGGAITQGLLDFPRTLRFVGPDTNRGFKDYLLKSSMQYAHKHPNVDGYYPGLAAAWSVDAEHNRVYIQINPAAKWSDRTPITTADVLYAFYFYRSPYIQSPVHNHDYNKRYTSVTRYSDHVFSITASGAKKDLLHHTLPLSPVPQHFFKCWVPTL